MAISDDDEMVTEVSNYYFEDERGEAVPFSCLPLHLDANMSCGHTSKEQVFLRGEVDGGLRKFWSQAVAWKFDLLTFEPEISVLLKNKNWVKLRKPRKSYENESIRSILITVQCLQFLRRDPQASAKSMWDHVSKWFCSLEVGPSQSDLVCHIDLIAEAAKRDHILAESKLVRAFLDVPGGILDKVLKPTFRQEFIVVGDDIVDDDDGDDDSSEDEILFDSVCAFCDNGGELLCCEGSCMRSFHATLDAGVESQCESLGLSTAAVKAMTNFFCKNCQYKQHQCFACGKLGASDKCFKAEVFHCVSATCGYFYHPHCVATLLHPEDSGRALEVQEKIAAGESFACPVHMCCVCKQGEDKNVNELQLAICRRCPTSYHRKCLPREISFEDLEDEDMITRAWDNLLPRRVLIYCLKHEIDENIGTPIRDHIKFPGVEAKKTSDGASKTKFLPNKRIIPSEGYFRNAARKLPKHSSPAMGKSISFKSNEKRQHGPDHLNKFEVESSQISLVRKKTNSEREIEKSLRKRRHHQLPQLDADGERRLQDLIRDAESSITLEDVIRKHKCPSTHMQSSKSFIDKTITMGKVEGSVKAVRVALDMLEKGCSIAEAKAVCEPAVLNQVSKWRNKLQVYLQPFLFGPRYTSFGRHFTKVEKLEAIVQKLHWYVEDGDMIVDFCCGANDFSLLMKAKLEAFGKKCSYKNFDIMPAAKNFNFEMRDWMTVQKHELPRGSRLVIGLNPPFGFEAYLANKFIDKALEFNPKLMILIVPPETKRLDQKENKSYDLIWEDEQLLSGKSFYLPGSIDENSNQIEQWNNTTPPLYLWSRSDKAAKNKAIAEKHGHLSKKALSLPCIDRYNQAEDDTTSCHDIPMEIDEQERQQDRPSSSKFHENRYHHVEPPIVSYSTSRTNYTMPFSRDSSANIPGDNAYKSYMDGLERGPELQPINSIYSNQSFPYLGYQQMGSQIPTATSYPYMGSGTSADRMNTSATQRYAPRLDEMNQPPRMTRGIYDTGAVQSQLQGDHLMGGFTHGPRYPEPPPPGVSGWR